MLDARKIIDFAAEDNAKEMRESLYASIYDRVTSHIEAKKQEVASTLLGMPLSTESVEYTEEEILDEEKEEGHEDEAEDKAMCKDAAKKAVKKHEKRLHGENY
jgi:hypothetical protein